MRNSNCVLLFVSLVVAAAAAQNPTPTTIPNGLPEWAYNIPDKVQPPEQRIGVSAARSRSQPQSVSVSLNRSSSCTRCS